MSKADAFRPVTRQEPCLICGRVDWCRRSASGGHECHRIDETEVNGFVRIVRTPAGFAVYRRPDDRRNGKWNGTLATKRAKHGAIRVDLCVEDLRFRAALSSDRKTTIGQQLGVSVTSLDSIGIGMADYNALKRLRASGRGWKGSHPQVASSFPERDATGAIIGFCFRTDDGRKGSPSGNVGAKRGLITPATLSTRSDPVLVVEGPSDAAACETLGLASVGRPSNTSGGDQIAQLLAQHDVLIVGENDRKRSGTWPGRDGAQKLAVFLSATWQRAVRWALPPAECKDIRAYLQHLAAHGLDLNDDQACHEAGQTLLETLTAAATEERPRERSTGVCNDEMSAREVLLELCQNAGDEFFHDLENRAYVLVREGDVARTLPVKSREYSLLLGWRYFRATESGLPATAKNEAIATLEGLAIYEGPEEPVFVRVGEHEGRVVLDLCDGQWRVVVIDKDGWRIVDESPIRFRQTRGMLALPAPVRGGSIKDLRAFINVATEREFILVCAFILGCLNPNGPFMILLVNGEPGSAKTTLCRLIRALIDPNKAPLRSEPKDERDLAIAANNAWMVGLDNMSRVSERMSNALCRLATGGGFATRELYTDADETIFDAMRPIMINGIGDIADRSDLIDRALRLTLPTIPERERRTERYIWSQFQARQPAILGAFLDAISGALRNRAAVRFKRLPRMADSASWIVTAEPACPWPPGSFVAALEDQQREADEFVIEANPLATAIRGWVQRNGSLEGRATDILKILSADIDEKVLKDRKWPKGAPALGTKLREIAPNLRRLGFNVQFDRDGARRTITVRPTEEIREAPSSLSSSSETASDHARKAESRV